MQKGPKIRHWFQDRGDIGVDGEVQEKPKRSGSLSVVGGKAKEVSNILKRSEIEKYLDSKGTLLIYGSQIVGTPVDKEMNKKDFLILYEEKDIDDEIEFDVHPRVDKVVRIQHYIYRDEAGDIMYFRNPFYEGDVLDCMEYEYNVVNHRGKYIEKGTELIERPEYNTRFLEKLKEDGYNLMDINFLPEEFDDQMTIMVKLISSIYGQTIIKGAETEMSF